MWFKRKKNNILCVSDNRGFTISISRERFNKLDVLVNTQVEDFVVDAHFEALNHRNSYLLSLLLKRSELVALTQDLLSVGRIKWNLLKIYRKMERIVKSISKKTSSPNSKKRR